MKNISDNETFSKDDTSQKVVVHIAYPLWRKHLLVAVARAKELQENGNDVVVSYCNNKAGTCAVNYAGSPAACMVCRSRARGTAEAAGLQTVPLETPPPSEIRDFPLTLEDRRELVEGVQSGITTTFRAMKGEVPRRSLIDVIRKRYYKTATGMLQAFDALVRKHAATRIEVFNGRQACSRFCLITARRNNIPFNTLEVTTRQKPYVFRGHTAHDRGKIQERILTQPVDYDVAEKFYAARRQPKDNKFAKQHAAAFQPPDSSGFSKRISIFLSSQDEFESLGAEWVSPFLDYAPIVERACRENPDYLFCIRFHPNQSDMVVDVLKPFEAIATLPNVRLFEPTSTANTYTLVEWSDFIVTFGSTITIESCWMNTPAIMLGPSLFDDLEISHNPDSVDEFLAMLRQELPNGSRDNAARFAWYEEFDCDNLRYVSSKGSKMISNGIRIRFPWIGQLMRTSDDIFCRAAKYMTRLSVRSETATPTVDSASSGRRAA